MEKTRQERLEIHLKMKAMLPSVKAELMAQNPDILDVMFGIKMVDGKVTNDFCWQVVVKKKLKKEEVKSGRLVPDEIAGYRTDIFEEPTIIVTNDDASYLPLWGGSRVHTRGVAGGGTMSCLVSLNSNGRVHLMGNQHVLNGGAASANALVGQGDSSPSKFCCCQCGDVAILGAGFDNGRIDAAIALLLNTDYGHRKTIAYENSILQIGPVFGSAPVISGGTTESVVAGDVVRKRGINTRLTVGTVLNITTSGGGKTGQIRIVPTVTPSFFQNFGDSGAALVNTLNQVVGVMWGKIDNGVTPPTGSDGVACRIDEVLTALLISVLSSGTPGTIPIKGLYKQKPIVNVSSPQVFGIWEQELQKTEQGKDLLQAILDNKSEVADLINDNREVKVAWNRYQGPAFVGHLMKQAGDKSHNIPPNINGYHFQNLLIRMTDVLERQGSRSLSAAVERYAPTAFNFADEFQKSNSLEKSLAKVNICPNCGTPNNLNTHGK